MITFSVAFRAVHVVLPSLYRRGFYADFYEFLFEFQSALDEQEFGELDEVEITWYSEMDMDPGVDEEGYLFIELDQSMRSMRGRNSEVDQLIWQYAMENNANVTVWEVFPGGYQGGVTHHFDFAPLNAPHDGILATGVLHFYDYETGGFMINVQASLLPLNQTMAIIDSLYVPVLTVIFFLSAIISYFYSHYLAKPIVELNATSKRLGKLELGGHIKMERSDEIGELSETLSNMALKLKDSLFKLQDANVKLQEEMEREREQERRRRDLFTSISHELKTPITILKGEIGGMIDEVGAYKDRDVYLRSAHGWTETLEKLVSEVLTISRLEGEGMTLDLEPVDLDHLTRGIYLDHQRLATMKNIDFVYDGDPGLVTEVDDSQLKMAIANVVNNAIFHSKEGSKVEMSLKRQGDVGVLVVTNEGSKISEEEIPHLFAPFYRVDKSRNRHTGGSGLGLFIVKNILELHGFKYGIANCEEGVVFGIRIPISNGE